MIAIESYNPRIGRQPRVGRYPKIANGGTFVFAGSPGTVANKSLPGSYLLRELLEFQVDRSDLPTRRHSEPRIA